MVDYSLAFVLRAQRAIEHGISDARTFQQLALASGVSIERVAEMLQEDLDNEGPIFGKFMRSLRGAAVASVGAAERTGEIIGHIDIDAMGLEEALSLADVEDIIDHADPDELGELERAADAQGVMWVCMLVGTCPNCLPIHGTVMTRGRFKADGLVPGPGGTMHRGWSTECKCRWVPTTEIDRADAMSPLKRIPKKDAQGRKISGRTTRAVAQKDVDKSVAAVAKSQETIEGRRALRVMGQANKEQP